MAAIPVAARQGVFAPLPVVRADALHYPASRHAATALIPASLASRWAPLSLPRTPYHTTSSLVLSRSTKHARSQPRSASFVVRTAADGADTVVTVARAEVDIGTDDQYNFKGKTKTVQIAVTTGLQANAGLPRGAGIVLIGTDGIALPRVELPGPFKQGTTKKFQAKVPAGFEVGAVQLYNPVEKNPVIKWFQTQATKLENQGKPGMLGLTVLNQFGVDWLTTGEWLVKQVEVGDAVVPCYGWVEMGKERVFFEKTAYLPGDEPEGLKDYRQDNLDVARSIYRFADYDDLGSPWDNRDPTSPGYRARLTPYPRRQKTVDRNIPLDERFSATKQFDFQIGAIRAIRKSILADPGVFFNIPWISPQDMAKKLFEGPQFSNYKKPVVLKLPGGPDTWKTDEEFGRQYLAGVHPNFIAALKALPQDFKVTDADVAGRLRAGKTLEDEIKAGRVFIADYSGLEPFLPAINTQTIEGEGRHLYAPRCLLYRNEKDDIIPIAIELERGGNIFSHVDDPTEEKWKWTLAKAYVASADSGWHQLGSHWLRCHAVAEPYLIALRRRVSELHPVFKLLLPHLKDTMQINFNARNSLINAGGTIEACFTPGAKALYVSAALYNGWRFSDQALPVDLKLRGVDSPDVLPHYPYREFGLEVYNGIEAYVKDYLSLYYTSDDAVKNDNEIQEWWEEVQRGHREAPDRSGFPELNTLADLVNILTIVVWTVSAYHAAVNFPQYDYSSFAPNHPSFITKPMPEGPVDAKSFMEALAKPKQAIRVATVVQLLVAKSEEEQFLAEDPATNKYSTPLLLEDKAKAVYDRFTANTKKLNEKLLKINADAVAKGGVAYPYLVPFPDKDLITGIPKSIAI